MAFQPAPGVWEVVPTVTDGSATFVNVLHVVGRDAPLGSPTPTQAEALITTWASQVIYTMCDTFSVIGGKVRDLSSAEGAVVEVTLPTPAVGLNGGPPAPLNAAFVITLRTAVGGRSGRGRIYLGGLSELVTGQRQVTSEYASTAVARVQAVRDTWEDGGYQMAVLSRQLGGTPRPAGLGRPVTSIGARDRRIDSQRRRLGK